MTKLKQIILAFMLVMLPIQVAWADNTELAMAVWNGDLKKVKSIMAKKKINGPTLDTLLYGASEQGHLEVVKYLHSKGADVNVKWNDYIGAPHDCCLTALMIATKNGHLDIVKFLISKGARATTHFRIRDGLTGTITALDFAHNAKKNKDALVEILTEAGAYSHIYGQ